MDKAWNKGIAPSVFRQSEMADLRFIMDMEDMRAKMKEDMEHNQKINQAMQAIQMGRRHG